jgi:soluble lytic murein transglycosylase
MYSQVRFPVSKARAAFWTAKAAEEAGDKETSENWYNTATAFPTTFYGQLASLKRYGTAPLHMPAAPQIGDDARQRFESRELVQAVKLLVELDEPDLASKLINHLIDTAGTTEDAVLAGNLGNQVGRAYLSVRAAKKAMQQQNAVVLLDVGYPMPKTPPGIDIERALALAIIRQESEFDPDAKSPSGALGMMQLRPSTAKENARKIRTSYKRDRLYEEEYNMTLGSHYLARLTDNYGGSYVMAIAAYNAGPGNVRKWVQQFGTPGNDLEKAINWIEKIPFTETRNYVQRVMENLEVYRHLEADAPKLQIGDDLVR